MRSRKSGKSLRAGDHGVDAVLHESMHTLTVVAGRLAVRALQDGSSSDAVAWEACRELARVHGELEALRAFLSGRRPR